MSDFQSIDEVYSVAEVARRLGVSKRSVYRLIRSGQLRALHIGTAWRVPAESLRNFIRGVDPVVAELRDKSAKLQRLKRAWNLVSDLHRFGITIVEKDDGKIAYRDPQDAVQENPSLLDDMNKFLPELRDFFFWEESESIRAK